MYSSNHMLKSKSPNKQSFHSHTHTRKNTHTPWLWTYMYTIVFFVYTLRDGGSRYKHHTQHAAGSHTATDPQPVVAWESRFDQHITNSITAIRANGQAGRVSRLLPDIEQSRKPVEMGDLHHHTSGRLGNCKLQKIARARRYSILTRIRHCNTWYHGLVLFSCIISWSTHTHTLLLLLG